MSGGPPRRSSVTLRLSVLPARAGLRLALAVLVAVVTGLALTGLTLPRLTLTGLTLPRLLFLAALTLALLFQRAHVPSPFFPGRVTATGFSVAPCAECARPTCGLR